MLRPRALALATLSLALFDAAPSGATKEIGSTADAMTLTSPKFEHQGELPARYTCDGIEASPPLQWAGEPAKTQSLVLIVEDPDANDAHEARRAYTHWLVFDIPPSAHVLNETLHESLRARRNLPEGAREGTNDAQRVGYSGPCPPSGRKHNYLFKLFALDVFVDLDAPVKAVLEKELHGHVLARAELIGTYERRKQASDGRAAE